MPADRTPISGGAIDRRGRGAGVEAVARKWLLRAGLQDVAANANYRGGELDLVMLHDEGHADGPTLVFIEVRFRGDARFGGGAASIDGHKRRKLVRAASIFLLKHPRFANGPCRFDVIDASGDPEAPDITWLRDAFRADD